MKDILEDLFLYIVFSLLFLGFFIFLIRFFKIDIDPILAAVIFCVLNFAALSGIEKYKETSGED